ncbi:hypothetical protein BC830DRAFT_540055 [Chytriomyces sp. MP71]|nr:hypothetical protein BC830DRAFT_540055 [Chytriomyces sp. MP71]
MLGARNNTAAAHVSRLPAEVVQDVVAQLPITHQLRHVALASKSLFSQLILADVEFARIHLRALRQRNAQWRSLWDVLDALRIRGDAFACLPLSYRIGIYAEIILESDWAHAELVSSSDFNLMWFERWPWTDGAALRMCRHLLAVPSINIASEKNRLFRWMARSGKLDAVR